MRRHFIPLASLLAVLAGCSQNHVEDSRVWAAAPRPLLRDATVLRQQRHYREQISAQAAAQMTATQEQKTAQSELLRYPDNWPSISAERDKPDSR